MCIFLNVGKREMKSHSQTNIYIYIIVLHHHKFWHGDSGQYKAQFWAALFRHFTEDRKSYGKFISVFVLLIYVHSVVF